MKLKHSFLYEIRFELYLCIQLIVLFGSLVVPIQLFNTILLPLFFSLGALAGVLIVSKNRKTMWFCIGLFLISIIILSGLLILQEPDNTRNKLIRFFIYFIINIVVTWHIIKQVWKEKVVDRKVIVGLIAGYISLGFVGFYLFVAIDLLYVDAFTGVYIHQDLDLKHLNDGLLYYSFITLLTIGYGDIVPAIPIAQKATILIGLIGQFYVTIVTAIIVTKYINYSILNMDK
ncbi:potassium channel family protein [Tenacibaculum sp. SG-28]|uniref:potassium channel family protein n=1 Tax=Tenacibaculum sp. SG-28 TaxID=754426 RepID=UPI000CF5380A|nr:potassium channel family protein [Tenacibaculum sp. SG-28]